MIQLPHLVQLPIYRLITSWPCSTKSAGQAGLWQGIRLQATGQPPPPTLVVSRGPPGLTDSSPEIADANGTNPALSRLKTGDFCNFGCRLLSSSAPPANRSVRSGNNKSECIKELIAGEQPLEIHWKPAEASVRCANGRRSHPEIVFLLWPGT